jgi:hypothetical protein
MLIFDEMFVDGQIPISSKNLKNDQQLKLKIYLKPFVEFR